jgi:hypothetical protein
MFDFLDNLPNDQLTGGVYHAIRIITHVKQIKEKAAATGGGDPATAREEAVCEAIIAEIEQTEGLHLRELPKHVASHYVAMLAHRLQSLLKERLRYDDSRGDALLHELRKFNVL